MSSLIFVDSEEFERLKLLSNVVYLKDTYNSEQIIFGDFVIKVHSRSKDINGDYI